jgi:hypothetical protein
MKIAHIVLVIAVLGLIGTLVMTRLRAPAPATTLVPVVTRGSIVGCYRATISKDIYTMKIDSQDGLSIEGTLSYKNFEKDSSEGTLTGVYDGAMLFGDYTFKSEGVNSIAQVAFKKTPDGFVRGFGSTQTVGNKEMLTDTTTLSYDSSPIFVKTECK